MYQHHTDAIKRICAKLQKDPAVKAVIIGGSVAHGFAGPSSDIDIMIVLDEHAYAERLKKKKLLYLNIAAITSARYKGGMIDGKYISLNFLKKVARTGSEPARFAFKDAFIGFSRIKGLEALLEKIAQYPVKNKTENIRSFCAQFEAWYWYAQEGIKKNNEYLIRHSVNNMVLFGGRIILAQNEILFPYHKWFLSVLESAPDKPKDVMKCIDAAVHAPDADTIKALYRCVKKYKKFPLSFFEWPSIFMADTELAWMTGHVAVGDR